MAITANVLREEVNADIGANDALERCVAVGKTLLDRYLADDEVEARSAVVGTTVDSTAITAASSTFELDDVGAAIRGFGLLADTTITAVASARSATVSQAATATATVDVAITRPLPADIEDEAWLAVAVELWHLRNAPNGVLAQQFGDPGSGAVSPVRVGGDPLRGARNVLRLWTTTAIG